MSGLSFGVKTTTDSMDAMAANLGNKAMIKRTIGNIGVRSVQQNIYDGGRPTKWRPLHSVTVTIFRRKMSSVPLRDTGRLAGGVHWIDKGGDSLAISTSRDAKAYAAIQHFGGDITITQRMRRFLHWKGFHVSDDKTVVTIPSRKFMLIPDDDKQEMVDAVGFYIMSGVK